MKGLAILGISMLAAGIFLMFPPSITGNFVLDKSQDSTIHSSAWASLLSVAGFGFIILSVKTTDIRKNCWETYGRNIAHVGDANDFVRFELAGRYGVSTLVETLIDGMKKYDKGNIDDAEVSGEYRSLVSLEVALKKSFDRHSSDEHDVENAINHLHRFKPKSRLTHVVKRELVALLNN